MSKLKRTAIKIVWQVLPAPTHAPHSTRSYDFYVSSGISREFSVALRLTCNATSPYINVRVPKACSLHEPASPKSVLIFPSVIKFSEHTTCYIVQ